MKLRKNANELSWESVAPEPSNQPDSLENSKKSEMPLVQGKLVAGQEPLSAENLPGQQVKGLSLNPLSNFAGELFGFEGASQEEILKCNLNRILNPNADLEPFNRIELEKLDQPEEQVKVLQNLEIYQIRKKLGLLPPKIDEMHKKRKTTRVVSEGAKQPKPSEKRQNELLLEKDIFPSMRLGAPSNPNLLMKRQATHSRVSSANLISTRAQQNKFESIRKESPKKALKNGLSTQIPANYEFQTPMRSRPFLAQPPRLSPLSWQRKAKEAFSRDGCGWAPWPDAQFPLTPSKWFPSLKKRPLLKIEETCQENEGNPQQPSSFGEDIFSKSGSGFNMILKKGEGNSFLTERDDTKSNFEIRMDRFDSLFAAKPCVALQTELALGDAGAPKTHSILNPNVISFEENIFDSIFEGRAGSASARSGDSFGAQLETKSKKSKSSSNEKSAEFRKL